jgi:hypothetical protein
MMPATRTAQRDSRIQNSCLLIEAMLDGDGDGDGDGVGRTVIGGNYRIEALAGFSERRILLMSLVWQTAPGFS